MGLRELARTVGVSPAAPYRHFDSRLSLLEALAVIGFRRFTEKVTAARDGGSPREQLYSMGRAYVGFALDNPHLFRLMFSPELERSSRPVLGMAADQAFASLREVADGLGGDGRILSLRAWAQVHGLAVLMLDGQMRLQPNESAEGLIAAVIGGIAS